MASSVEEEAEGEPLTPGEPGYVEALRRDLERSRPTVPQDFDLEEVYFWNHRHVPPGSVLEVISGGPEETAPSAAVALLVTSSESAEEGVWVGVTVLGAESEEVKKSLQAYFKGGRRMVHLCRIDAGGSCPVGEEEGMHLRRFRWHPPGDFRAAWLSSYALKKVRDGPKLAMETQKQAGEENKGGKKKATTSGPSETERRLSSLRARGPRVSFGEEPGSHTTSGAPAGDPGGRRVGILRRPAGSERAVVPTRALEDKVKVETVDLTTRSSRSPSRTRRGRRMESGLVEAAATYQQKQEKKDGRRRRDRSRSRRKKKRDRRKRRSSSSSRSSRSRSSSGSSSLLPPLRRKSERQPGLVFRLLEQQAYDYLAQDGVLEDRDASVDTSRRPKTLHLLSAGSQARAGCKRKRCQRIGALVQSVGHAEGREVGFPLGPSSSSPHGGGNIHPPGVGHRSPPRALRWRGRRHGAGPRAFGCPKAWETGGTRRWQGVVATISHLARRLVWRRSNKRKRQGAEGQRQERQGQRKRRKAVADVGWRQGQEGCEGPCGSGDLGIRSEYEAGAIFEGDSRMMLACHAADGPAGVASPLHRGEHNDGTEFKTRRTRVRAPLQGQQLWSLPVARPLWSVLTLQGYWHPRTTMGGFLPWPKQGRYDSLGSCWHGDAKPGTHP